MAHLSRLDWGLMSESELLWLEQSMSVRIVSWGSRTP